MTQSVKELRSDPVGVAPVRPVRLGPRDVTMERRPDGAIHLRSPHSLGRYPLKLTERLEYWAHAAPDRTFMAQRERHGGGDWNSVSYRETLAAVRRIGAALLTCDLSVERPLAILSGNDLDHALLGLAAIYVGIPYAPISPAYSLLASDFGKLRHALRLLTPGLVFAADGEAYRRAIDATIPPDTRILVRRNPPRGRPTMLFEEFLAQSATACVDAAHAAVGPDTVAKILFTSGSTGLPKGVINTQRMWCSNQAMIASALAFFEDEPPIIVDWAPWHHTAGGNHNVGLVLYNGGTLYIDEGKPLAGAIAETVRNLREIAPTWYFTVPKGFEALLPHLRAEAPLRNNFFRRLKVLWFAGAGIAQDVFEEMKELAIKSCGERILFLTGFGATETAPCALVRTWESAQVANMGVPAIGTELKLVPSEGKLEARVKGPHVTPGYWREPQLTAQAFDEEGFYRLGDAFKLADPMDARAGLLFDGRIAEDFKLSTGTWVSVGPLRTRLLEHLAPFARDAVLSGPDRSELAALIFPDLAACRSLAAQLAADAQAAEVLSDPAVVGKFRDLLGSLARSATGSSHRVCRAILLAEPPSFELGEITDKGSINQRAVLEHRAAIVEELHAKTVSSRSIVVAGVEPRP